jgi:hypothetical protein
MGEKQNSLLAPDGVGYNSCGDNALAAAGWGNEQQSAPANCNFCSHTIDDTLLVGP